MAEDYYNSLRGQTMESEKETRPEYRGSIQPYLFERYTDTISPGYNVPGQIVIRTKCPQNKEIIDVNKIIFILGLLSK